MDKLLLSLQEITQVTCPSPTLGGFFLSLGECRQMSLRHRYAVVPGLPIPVSSA